MRIDILVDESPPETGVVHEGECCLINWPASHEKGPSNITHSEDPDQPLYDIGNIYA